MVPTLLLVALFAATPESDLPPGQVIAHVACAGDASQSYALYLPSGYTSDRAWPVIYAFDPGGRGQNPVERYQAAAEKYGYIVAGSNNSRNGPWAVSIAAVAAMTGDVAARFHVDEKRRYVAGMSGGSRVALGVALSSPEIAGVIASSAGYPDNKPRKELSFPVFGTAGTEDFNYWEMRDMDRDLTTPHRLRIFPGAHMWLPSDVAMEAVEWMELQAMKSGRKPVDAAEVEAIFAKRAGQDTYAAVHDMVTDFAGLKDVTAASRKLAGLKPDNRSASKDQETEEYERATSQLALGEQNLLMDASHRATALKRLGELWKRLSAEANAMVDTPKRQSARRVLSGLSMSVSSRDPEYLAIVRQYRMGASYAGAIK